MKPSYEINTGQLYSNAVKEYSFFNREEASLFLSGVIHSIVNVQKSRGLDISKDNIAKDNLKLVYRLGEYTSFKSIPRYIENPNLKLKKSGGFESMFYLYYDLTADVLIEPATEGYPELFLYYVITYPDVYTLDQFLKRQSVECLKHSLDLLFLFERAIPEKEGSLESLSDLQKTKMNVTRQWLTDHQDKHISSLPSISNFDELTAREWILISKYLHKYLGVNSSALSKVDRAKFALVLSQKPMPDRIQNSDFYKQYDRELKDKKLKLKYLRSIARYFELYKYSQIVDQVKSDISDLEENTRKDNI